MASNIDPTQPPASNPTTAAMRANMQAAKDEIEALNKNGLEIAHCLLINTAINNNTVPSGTGVSLTNYRKVLFDNAVIDTHNVGNLTTSRISIPPGATHAKVKGHISFPAQSIGQGRASCHLWRYIPSGAPLTPFGEQWFEGVYDQDRPTPEAHYHNRVMYNSEAVIKLENYLSIVTPTGFIPIFSPQEEWSLYAWQNSGAQVTLPSGQENWLWAEFRF